MELKAENSLEPCALAKAAPACVEKQHNDNNSTPLLLGSVTVCKVFSLSVLGFSFLILITAEVGQAVFLSG